MLDANTDNLVATASARPRLAHPWLNHYVNPGSLPSFTLSNSLVRNSN